LGEIFECKWEHESDKSVTKFISEQVSHSPPISCFYSFNSKRKFSYYGYVEPTLGFHWNSVHSEIKGDINVELWGFEEKYKITYPKVYCTGMFMGSRNIEIWNNFDVVCESTGFSCHVELKSNDFTGKVSKGKKTHYTLRGNLTGDVFYKLDKEENLAYNSKKMQREKIIVTPIEKQKSNESRRVWHNVTTSIRKKEYQIGNKEKNIVEQLQRDAKLERESKNIEWKPVHFEWIDKTWVKKKPPHHRVNSIHLLMENYDLSPSQVKNLKSNFIEAKNNTISEEDLTNETKLSEEEFENLRIEVLKLLEKKSSKVDISNEEEKELNETIMKKGSILSSSFPISIELK
jgi:hypothetical protein